MSLNSEPEHGIRHKFSGSGAKVSGLSLSKRAKIRIRNGLARALLPVARIENRLQPRIPILLYHRVLPEFPHGSARTGNVQPEEFDVQMGYLARKGYSALSVSELKEISTGKKTMPGRPVLITFDDGYADNYFVAFPIASMRRATDNASARA